MREPLLQLLFPAPITSFSSNSSSSLLLATRPISRPIDLIISDLFVLPPVWEGYRRNIMTYLFVPNSLMAFMRYINISMDKIESGGLGLNFDRQMHETISLAKGLICNSILELDGQVLNELRRQSLPGSNIPILFVAPLMSEDLDQKRHVRIRIRSYERTPNCLASYDSVLSFVVSLDEIKKTQKGFVPMIYW
jgi:hypothetical protein